jgi:Na+/proline symporter
MAFAIIAIAFAWFFRKSMQMRSESWTYSNFYMGTRNIGAPLTGQIFWGTSFSFANGIFYFSTLAYYKGLAVIWFQIPWMASIWFLAWRLPELIKITEKFTLHGFLGDVFGRKAAVAAAWTTVIGFLGMIAFEINVSSELISRALNAEQAIIPLTMFSAIAAVSYTDAGGFVGAAQTDRIQNRLGLIAVFVVIISIYLMDAGYISGSGVSNNINFSFSALITSVFDFSAFDIITVLGVLCFATATNIVDMSNWQTISANSASKPEDIKMLRSEMVKASGRILVAPAIVGSLIGFAFRGVEKDGQPIADIDIIPTVIDAIGALHIYGLHVGVILLAVCALGLISMAMSTIDSYLLATSQSIEWDIRRSLEKIKLIQDTSHRARSEAGSIRRARNEMYILAFFACTIFILARSYIGDQTVFVFQFAIFGAITALLPAILLGLSVSRRDEEVCPAARALVLASIVVGVVGSLGVFALATNKPEAMGDFNAYAWAPIASLGLSGILVFIASLLKTHHNPSTI